MLAKNIKQSNNAKFDAIASRLDESVLRLELLHSTAQRD